MSARTWLAAGLAHLPPPDPPLVPTREQAREWARDELAGPVYARARPGLVQRGIEWVLDRLGELRVRPSLVPDARTGIVLVVLVMVILAVVVLLRTGRIRGPGGRGGHGVVFDDRARTAADYRRLADTAASEGRWQDAVRERFRAVVRSLEEQVVLDERPGRTADEAARDGGLELPGCAAALAAGALTFDEICYGERTAEPRHDQQLRELDELVCGRTPARRTTSGAGVAP